jgi:hypothetical protein
MKKIKLFLLVIILSQIVTDTVELPLCVCAKDFVISVDAKGVSAIRINRVYIKLINYTIFKEGKRETHIIGYLSQTNVLDGLTSDDKCIDQFKQLFELLTEKPPGTVSSSEIIYPREVQPHDIMSKYYSFVEGGLETKCKVRRKKYHK